MASSLKVKGSVMLRMVSQLAIMHDVGVTAFNAVRALAASEPNARMKEFLERSEASIANGMRLSEAISIDPTPFNEGQVAMIEAGETGGFLPKVLMRISKSLEYGQELRRQLKTALAFPVATIVIALGILTYMLIKVVPGFVKIFEDTGTALPGLTLFVVNLSNMASEHPLVTVAIAVGICVGIIKLPSFIRKTPAVQTLVLRLPALGQFVRDKMVAEFFVLMGQLIDAGVTIEKSLVISKGLSTYEYYQENIEAILRDIRSGVTLSVSMGQRELFGPANAQIVHTGEDAGRLGEVMGQVGERYEKELAYKLKLVTTYAELAAIGVSGTIVGIIVYAMFMPMLDISSTIK